MDVRDRTAWLRDFARQRAGRNPPTFLWPKYNMAPYYSQGDILPTREQVEQMPFEEAEEAQIAFMRAPPLPAAILQAVPRAEHDVVIQNNPQHVRNFDYIVRWAGRPHTENSATSYEDIWSSQAFQEFMEGSTLTGHVPPQQFQQLHMRQVNNLLQGGQRPQMVVPMANPAAQAQILREYLPASAPQRASRQGIEHAERLPPFQFQIQENFHDDDNSGPLDHSIQQADSNSQSQQQGAALRRSSRVRSQYAPFGDDFR